MKRKYLILLGLLFLMSFSVSGQERGKLLEEPDNLFPTYLAEKLKIKWTYRNGWGYINSAGNVVIPLRFTAAGHFSEGLAPVQIGKFELTCVPPLFDEDEEFCSETTKESPSLKNDDKWGYIDKTGNFIIEPQFDAAGSFSENMARIKIGDKFGYIDKSGKIVIDPQFDDAGIFSEGLAWIRIGNKYGYINHSGKTAFPLSFNIANNFAENIAVIKIEDLYGYVDQKGNIIIKPQFVDAGSFSNGIAKVKVGTKWGYIDKLGRFVIKPQFEEANSFSENMAAAKSEGHWGFINKKGNFVIKPTFDEAGFFSEKLGNVRIKNMWGYINEFGKFVIPPTFNSAKPFYKGIGVVKKDAGDHIIWAYLNTKGREVIRQNRFVFNAGAGYGFYDNQTIHLWSIPTGATVYLIPLYDFENDPDIINDNEKLWRYQVAQGRTDLDTEQAEKVFVAVFVLKTFRQKVYVDVRKGSNATFGVNFE